MIKWTGMGLKYYYSFLLRCYDVILWNQLAFQVFVEYLEKKEGRLPNFLTRVVKLQEEISAMQQDERGTANTKEV